MRGSRPDHRVPAYQHREVTLAELGTRAGKAVRRLLWMAWPGTPEAILHRLRVDAFSYSSEEAAGGGTLVTVSADIRNRDIARNAPASNPDGPWLTVTVVTRETGLPAVKNPKSNSRSNPRTSEVVSARIIARRDGSDLGCRASDIEEAVLRMQLACETCHGEYESISRALEAIPADRRRSAIMGHLLRLRALQQD